MLVRSVYIYRKIKMQKKLLYTNANGGIRCVVHRKQQKWLKNDTMQHQIVKCQCVAE